MERGGGGVLRVLLFEVCFQQEQKKRPGRGRFVFLRLHWPTNETIFGLESNVAAFTGLFLSVLVLLVLLAVTFLIVAFLLISMATLIFLVIIMTIMMTFAIVPTVALVKDLRSVKVVLLTSHQGKTGNTGQEGKLEQRFHGQVCNRAVALLQLPTLLPSYHIHGRIRPPQHPLVLHRSATF